MQKAIFIYLGCESCSLHGCLLTEANETKFSLYVFCFWKNDASKNMLFFFANKALTKVCSQWLETSAFLPRFSFFFYTLCACAKLSSLAWLLIARVFFNERKHEKRKKKSNLSFSLSFIPSWTHRLLPACFFFRGIHCTVSSVLIQFNVLSSLKDGRLQG